MKTITKKPEPQAFTDWKQVQTRTWKGLKNPVKKTVKRSLIQEQGHICGYCERRLVENDSHIEHFKPRNNPSVDDLEFSNLLCSCIRQLAKGNPSHCGHAKGQCDASLLVSPFEPSCEKRFLFTSDGQILPASDSDTTAQTTIDKLNLDAPKLRALRTAVILPFEDIELSDDDLKVLVQDHLSLSTAGEYGEFWTTIQSLFGGLA